MLWAPYFMSSFNGQDSCSLAAFYIEILPHVGIYFPTLKKEVIVMEKHFCFLSNEAGWSSFLPLASCLEKVPPHHPTDPH